jgi:hypothetical protein
MNITPVLDREVIKWTKKTSFLSSKPRTTHYITRVTQLTHKLGNSVTILADLLCCCLQIFSSLMLTSLTSNARYGKRTVKLGHKKHHQNQSNAVIVKRCAANIIKVYFKNEKKPIFIEICIHSLKYHHIYKSESGGTYVRRVVGRYVRTWGGT